MTEFRNAKSIAALAKQVGVPRQRIYNEIKRGHIKATEIGDTLAISPAECARVVDAAVTVQTATGTAIRFAWV